MDLQGSVSTAVVPATGPEPALTIVVPAFQEERRLPDLLADLRLSVDRSTHEVVVVDDGSTDATSAVAAAGLVAFPHQRVIRLARNHGKGGALAAGVAAARGKAIALLDADGATDLGALDQARSLLESLDVVVGSRCVAGASVSASLHRAVMGRAFNAIVRATTDLSLTDTQCGFKVFRAPVARLLFGLSEIEGYAIDVEVLVLAHRLGLRIGEVPVAWREVPGSKVRVLRDSLRMTRDVVRLEREHGDHLAVFEVPSEDAVAAAARVAANLPRGTATVHVDDRLVLVTPLDRLDKAVRVVELDHGGPLVIEPVDGPLEAVGSRLLQTTLLDEAPVVLDPDIRQLHTGWSARQASRRLLRRGKYRLGHSPAWLPLLVALTPEGRAKAITRRTQLVVEGFPRSGNTFTVFALRHASNGALQIASHVHHPSQVRAAVRRGLPTLLVLRPPLDALASYLVCAPHGRPAIVLNEYIEYHQEILPLVDRVLVATFDQVTTDLPGVSRRLEQRFGLVLPHFSHSEHDTAAVLDAIEKHHARVHRFKDTTRVMGRPSGRRVEESRWVAQSLRHPRHRAALEEAEALYLRLKQHAGA